MKKVLDGVKSAVNRRSFMKNGVTATAAATLGAGLLADPAKLFGEDPRTTGALTQGDAAILRFLSAAEILETDLWQQYNELGGIQDEEVPGGSGNEEYTEALETIDEDFPIYIHDNTDDEISHFRFINAYLEAKGSQAVNLEPFRTLQGSKATGAAQTPRLTNLMQLTVDTSWYTRYRIDNKNPDLDPNFKFPQAVPSLAMGQFPAIPRDDEDLEPHDHIQAIANTAAFHFAFIESGGTSLYPSLAQRVTSVEVLRILLSIGPTETAHFQIWHDNAGGAPALTDPKNPSLVFPDLEEPPFGGETFGPELIMPEPCPFLSRKFPRCSIIRPTKTEGAAMGALKALTADGLFIGQSPQFFEFMRELAEAADAARRLH